MSRTTDNSLVTEKWLIVKWGDDTIELIDGDLLRPYNDPDSFRSGQQLTVRTPEGTRQATLLSGSNNFEDQTMQLELMRWVISQQIEVLKEDSSQTQPHTATFKLSPPKRSQSNETQPEKISPESATSNTSNISPEPGPSNITSGNNRSEVMDQVKQDSSDYDSDSGLVIPHVRMNYGSQPNNSVIPFAFTTIRMPPGECIGDSLISILTQIAQHLQTRQSFFQIQTRNSSQNTLSIEDNSRLDETVRFENQNQRSSHLPSLQIPPDKQKIKNVVSCKSHKRNTLCVSPQPGPSNITASNTRNDGMLQENRITEMRIPMETPQPKPSQKSKLQSKKQQKLSKRHKNKKKIIIKSQPRNALNESPQPGPSNAPFGNTRSEPVNDQAISDNDSDTATPHVRKHFGMPVRNKTIAKQNTEKHQPPQDNSTSQNKSIKKNPSLSSKKHKNKKKQPLQSETRNTLNVSPQPGPSTSSRNEVVEEQKSSDYDSDTVIPHMAAHHERIRAMQTPVIQPQLDQRVSLHKQKPQANGYQSQSARRSNESDEPVPFKKRKLPSNGDQSYSKRQTPSSSNVHDNHSNKKQSIENERPVSMSPQPGPSHSINNNTWREVVNEQELTDSEGEPVNSHPSLPLQHKLMKNTASFNTQPSECSECVRNNALQLLFALKTKQKVEEVNDILKRLGEITTEITRLQSQDSTVNQSIDDERQGHTEEITRSNIVTNAATQSADIISPSGSLIRKNLQAASVGHENIMTSIDNEVNRIRRILQLNADTELKTNENDNDEHNRVQMIPIGNGNTQVPYDEYLAIDWNFYVHATRSLLLSVFPRSMIAASSLDSDSINDIVITVATNCHIDPALVRNSIRTICAQEFEKKQKKIKRRAEWNRFRQRKRPRKQSEHFSKKDPSPSSGGSSNSNDDVSSMS